MTSFYSRQMPNDSIIAVMSNESYEHKAINPLDEAHYSKHVVEVTFRHGLNTKLSIVYTLMYLSLLYLNQIHLNNLHFDIKSY